MFLKWAFIFILLRHATSSGGHLWCHGAPLKVPFRVPNCSPRLATSSSINRRILSERQAEVTNSRPKGFNGDSGFTVFITAAWVQDATKVKEKSEHDVLHWQMAPARKHSDNHSEHNLLDLKQRHCSATLLESLWASRVELPTKFS